MTLGVVYETESPVSRPEKLYDAMARVQSLTGEPRPMLKEIMQVSKRKLPHQKRFLSDWEVFLQTKERAEADALLREAIGLSRGTEGRRPTCPPSIA